MVGHLTAPNLLQHSGLFGQPVPGYEAQNALAQHLAGAVAKHALGTRVPAGDHAVQGLSDNRVFAVLDYRRELMGHGFEPPLHRDVTGYRGGAYDAAQGVMNGGNADRHVDGVAVLVRAHGLEMLDPFALQNFFQDEGLLVHAVGRKQAQQGLAHHLAGRVTKHRLGTRIPAADDAGQAFADDGVVGRLHQSAKVLQRLGVLHTVLRQLLVAD
jgi:hypothetical protein